MNCKQAALFIPFVGTLVEQNLTEAEKTSTTARILRVIRSLLTVALVITALVCPILSFLLIPICLGHLAISAVATYLAVRNASTTGEKAKKIALFTVRALLSLIFMGSLPFITIGAEVISLFNLLPQERRNACFSRL